MAETVSLQAQQKAQTLCSKSLSALERGNLDIAINLSKQALALYASSEQARRLYHQARMRKFKSEKKGTMSLKMGEVFALGKIVKIQSLSKSGKYDDALILAEELLDGNPTSPKFNEVYFDVAQRSTHPEALLVAMEILHEACPNDLDITRKMGDAYMKAGVYDKASDCYKKISAANPADLNLQKLVKDADAKNTMTAGGWEQNAGKQGGYIDLIRNKEQAKKLDTANKAVVTGDDADAMITELRNKIKREPKNINFYRGLARVYTQNKRFTEALNVLREAKVVNPSDPELDRILSATEVQNFDARILALKNDGKQDEADALTAEKNQFVFDDLLTRAEQYPNDLRLRYELGIQYFTYEAYEEAIQQFQLSQKSPKDRLESLYYLACCFNKMGKPDMAIMQLETANSQLQVMDDLKKRVMYMLGWISEESGKYDKAFTFYKDVYASDVGFKDISERMEHVYALRSGNE